MRTNHSDPTAVLAVDLGKSGCRVAVWDDAGAAPVIREGAGAPGLATPGGVHAAAKVILQTAATAIAAGGSPRLRACGIGAAGVAAAPEAGRQLLERLRNGLSTETVMVASDAITSHAGALAGEAGVVLAAGTGAVAIAVGMHGEFAKVDGWGPLLGDNGGGAWIGGAGLRAALRAYDGRGPETSLRTAAQHAFGDDLRRLPAAIGQDADAAGKLASFAPAVAAAAAAGDPPAALILDEAAEALAESITAAARHLRMIGEVPVALTGGLLHLGPALLDRLQFSLRRSSVPLDIQAAAGGSLDGARLLALRNDTALEPFLHRAVSRAPVGTA